MPLPGSYPIQVTEHDSSSWLLIPALHSRGLSIAVDTRGMMLPNTNKIKLSIANEWWWSLLNLETLIICIEYEGGRNGSLLVLLLFALLVGCRWCRAKGLANFHARLVQLFDSLLNYLSVLLSVVHQLS